MAEDQQETAKSFADVLNFPKRLGFLDEHTRIPLGPWGPWDGAAAILGLGLTGWGMYVWFYDGYARWIAMFGARGHQAVAAAHDRRPRTPAALDPRGA